VIFGQLLLEPQEHGTHDILAGFQNSVNVPVNLRFKVVILADMAVESDVHNLMMSWPRSSLQSAVGGAIPAEYRRYFSDGCSED
jgi:hypothetical protein